MGTTIAGYLGILNGCKMGKFAVSLNARDKSSLLNNLYNIFIK